MKLIFSVLIMAFASTVLAQANCHTPNTKALYYCEGEELVVTRTNKPYRPGIPFNVSICQDQNNNLIMEVFPFGLFTDHYTDEDFQRPTVRTAIFLEHSFMGRDIYKRNRRTQNTNYQTVYSIKASDWNKKLFNAVFYDGVSYRHRISGEMICSKQY